jgi:hypothetical protein
VRRPSGSLDISQTSGAAQLALAGHTKRALPRSSNSARLKLRLFAKYPGGAQGKELQFRFCVGTCAHFVFWCVVRRFAPNYGFGFAFDFGFFIFPCAPPSSADQTGGVRRICLSTWPRSGSCEFMRRPVWLSNAGDPAGAVRWGRLLFGYFFFGEARKSD